MKLTYLAVGFLFATTAAHALEPLLVAPSLAPPHYGPPAPITERGTTQHYPVVSLSASASAMAATDEMVVSLRSEREGTNMGSLNQAVLTELQAALGQAKATPGVRARMGSVRTHQAYSPQGKPAGWRVQGEVVFESKKLKELGDLTGQLSQKLQLANVSFRLSSEKKLELEQSLLASAAQAFRAKAQASALALGYGSFQLKEVNVSLASAGGQEPVVPLFAKSMDMREAAPVSLPTEAGETEVSVSMAGTVTLH